MLFVDASALGRMVDKTHRELSEENISLVADTYRAWRGGKDGGEYKDIPGFCKSAVLGEVRAHGYTLTPGRYVGAEEAQDDGEPFKQKMKRLTAKLEEQFEQSARLEATIRSNLKHIGYGP